MKGIELKKLWNLSRLRTAFIILIIVLFIGTAFCVGWTFSRPQKSGGVVTRVLYSHNGQFDYQVYVNESTLYDNPPQPEEQNSIYFTNIIDSIDVFFDYEFLTEDTIDEVMGSVEIRAILERTGE